MLKFDFYKLLSSTLYNKFPSHIVFILNDEPIVKKSLEDTLSKKNNNKTRSFNGVKSLEEFVIYNCSTDLFSENTDSVLFLEQNLTEKKWKEHKFWLSKLQCDKNNQCFIFGPNSARNYIDKKDCPKDMEIILSYSPNDFEKEKCLDLLAKKYSISQSSSKLLECLEYYGGDLYECSEHFARMHNGQIKFEEAFQASTSASGFDVVHALLSGDPAVFDLRLSQYFISGGDAGGILGALFYILKQVALFQNARTRTGNDRLAFTEAKIPFPAQEKIKNLSTRLKPEEIVHYLLNLKTVEYEVRQGKDPRNVFLSTLLIQRL